MKKRGKKINLEKAKASPLTKLNFAEGDAFGFSIKKCLTHFFYLPFLSCFFLMLFSLFIHLHFLLFFVFCHNFFNRHGSLVLINSFIHQSKLHFKIDNCSFCFFVFLYQLFYKDFKAFKIALFWLCLYSHAAFLLHFSPNLQSLGCLFLQFLPLHSPSPSPSQWRNLQFFCNLQYPEFNYNIEIVNFVFHFITFILSDI